MKRVVAVVAVSRLDTPEATEFLRVLAALRAVGMEVQLVELGPGEGALGAPEGLKAHAELEPDGERYWTALREDGVAPQAASTLPAAIEAADAVVVLAARDRTGEPPVLALPARTRPSPETLRSLPSAGQVVLV